MAEIDKPLPNVDITEKDEAFVETEVVTPTQADRTKRRSRSNNGRRRWSRNIF